MLTVLADVCTAGGWRCRVTFRSVAAGRLFWMTFLWQQVDNADWLTFLWLLVCNSSGTSSSVSHLSLQIASGSAIRIAAWCMIWWWPPSSSVMWSICMIWWMWYRCDPLIERYQRLQCGDLVPRQHARFLPGGNERWFMGKITSPRARSTWCCSV